MMNLVACIWLVMVGLMAWSGVPAVAQVNKQAVVPAKPVLEQCRNDVLRFQEDMQGLKEAMGDQAAEDFQNSFMSREAWNSILLSEGYCGLSTRLRAKKLLR